MSIKFEVGKFYKRRDDRKLKLVHDFPNYLLFVDDDNVSWTDRNGRYVGLKDHPWDVIGEWSDKEIVEILIKVEVDENAKYVAVDLSGFVYQYSTKPKPMAATFRLENDRDTQKQVNIINWRETLTEVT